jgi:serine/threonine protein kinase
LDGEGEARFFRREVETLARLQHPGIAAIFEADRTEDGQAFFAMELVRGVPLDSAFPRSRTWSGGESSAGEAVRTDRSGVESAAELRTRLDLFLEVCSAVIYAHQRGVIHRDLKPSNILVSMEADSSQTAPRSAEASARKVASRSESSRSSTENTGRIKIVDFGLARIHDADASTAASVSELRVLQGTLPYMSPEQTLADRDAIDFRTDVYSLGVVLFRFLTGEPPYEVRSDSLLEAIQTIREQPPRKAGAIVPLLRGEIETILAKALEKEPDRRYRSVAELAEDLRRFLADQPILARPPSALYQLRKLARRHRAATALLAVLAVVLVGSTVTMSFLYESQRRAATRARTESKKAERINLFLQEMLYSASPDRTQGRAPSLETMLEEAANRVGESLASDPEIQAEVRRTLGNTYLTLGKLDDAEKHFREALHDRRELFGRWHPDVAESFRDLATVEGEKRSHAAAESLMREAIAINQRCFGVDADTLSADLNILARLLQYQGRYAEAESIQHVAIDMSARKGKTSIDHAVLLSNLATIYIEQAKIAPAESLLRAALEIQESALGGDHPVVVTTKNNLAVALNRHGRPDQAEPLYREVVDASRRILGEAHPLVGQRLVNLANLLRLQDRHGEAQALLWEAIRIQKEALGDEHLEVARSYHALALSLSALGAHAPAESLESLAYGIRSRAFGPGHDDVVRSMLGRARILRAAGRAQEALPLFRSGLEHFRSRDGLASADVALACTWLARAEADLGRWNVADSLLGVAVHVRRDLLGEDGPALAATLEEIAMVATLRRQSQVAETALRDAYRIYSRTASPADPRPTRVAVALGRQLTASGRSQEADSILSESYERIRSFPAAESMPEAEENRWLLEALAENCDSLGLASRAAQYRSQLSLR